MWKTFVLVNILDIYIKLHNTYIVCYSIKLLSETLPISCIQFRKSGIHIRILHIDQLSDVIDVKNMIGN